MPATTSSARSASSATCAVTGTIAHGGGKYAKKRAAVAVARKLAVLLHRLWRNGEAYDPDYNLDAAQRRRSTAKETTAGSAAGTSG